MGSGGKQMMLLVNRESGDTSLISWNPAVLALVSPSSKKERLGVDRGFFHRVEILEKNLIHNKKVVKVNG
jgi:hypothetical protein